MNKFNKGYEDGFSGSNESHPDTSEEYMSGYRIGQADRQQRLSHLKGKTESENGVDMRDWLNDKADSRKEERIIREYFTLEDDDPIPSRISDDDRAEIYNLIENGHYS